jgi:outer membrane lipoprotein SlyB
MNNESASIVLAVAFAFCAGSASAQNPSSMAPSTPSSAPSAANRSCATCGTIQSIRYVEQKGQGSGAGAVVGGVLGGVLGHQFGSGRGNTVATVAGVGVGAVAGNEVEKNVKKTSYYVVTVRLDNGGTQSVSQGSKPGLREGDRVRIENGNRLALLTN